MPKTRRSPQLVTRLASPDMKRFREAALARGVTYSAFLREAALRQLAYTDSAHVDELEGIYAAQLKGCTELIRLDLKNGINRICAMLAKSSIDTHAIYQFLGRIDDTSGDLMKECTSIAAKRLSRKLGTEEQGIARGMVTHVSQPS